MHKIEEEFTNFKQLSTSFPSLKKFIYKKKDGECTINFKNPKALRELVYAQLQVEFALKVEFPLSNLCPTVPNRLSYITWIEETLCQKEAKILGIDIGTGAVCIYPLLGCRRNKSWHFLATETSAESLAYAEANVSRNRLEGRISLYLNNTQDIIFPRAALTSEYYHFCMCNPPFYDSEDEVRKCRDKKKLPPSSTLCATSSELIYRGGEYSFIKKMIEESLDLKSKIKWFSTLIGKKSTFLRIVSDLDQMNVEVKKSTIKKGRTVRWVIAWTFANVSSSNNL